MDIDSDHGPSSTPPYAFRSLDTGRSYDVYDADALLREGGEGKVGGGGGGGGGGGASARGLALSENVLRNGTLACALVSQLDPFARVGDVHPSPLSVRDATENWEGALKVGVHAHTHTHTRTHTRTHTYTHTHTHAHTHTV